MKILLCVRGLRKREGGPTYTVPALAAALANRGHEVEILVDTYDIGRSSAFRIVRRSELEVPLSQYVKQFDVVHDNGVWLLFNHALAKGCRQAGVPRVVSPRGSLQPWVLKQRRLRKLLGWFLYQRQDFQSAQAMITTAEIEAEQIRFLGYGGQVHIVPNGVDTPVRQEPKKIDPEAKKIALFLARIHPKKGLADLIEAWIRLHPADWVLQVGGPDDLGIVRPLERRLAVEGMIDSVRFLGPIYGEKRTDLYRNASLYVLPTHSENFGVSVVEAMMMGTPVLTTTETPWGHLEAAGLGWITTPGVDPLAKALATVLSKPAEELEAIGNKARAYVEAKYTWSSIAESVEKIYINLCVESSGAAA